MKPAGTQTDKNMDFDGMQSMAPSRSTKFQTNQWSGHMNDGRLVQKAQAPNRTGNNGMCDTPRNLSASVTKDAHRAAPTSTMPKLPAQGSIRDNINRGAQVRNPGGTRMAKSPANPDKIRIGQGGGPSYGLTEKGSRPSTAQGQSDFNYGPKKQY
jgi:hypothetical protein